MKLTKIFLACLGLTLFSASIADVIVFESVFQELPENWYSTVFTFGPTGAVCYFQGTGMFDASLCTGGMPPEANIFIPDGADSVHIDITHRLDVSGGEYPNMDFFISLLSNSNPGEIYWDVSIDPNNPQVNQTYNHTFSPEWLQGGDHLGMHFRVDAVADEWGSTVNWKIQHVKVTVYGDNLSFQQTTWGAIKATLQ